MLRWHMPGTGPIRDLVFAVSLHCIFRVSRSVMTLLYTDHRLAGWYGAIHSEAPLPHAFAEYLLGYSAERRRV